MSQEVKFDIPFPPRINAEAEAAGLRHLEWARRFGRVRYLHATGADLDLGSDIFGWFLLYGMTVQIINVVNDVLSLDKEESRGDPHNLLPVRYSRADIRPSNLPAFLEDLTQPRGE